MNRTVRFLLCVGLMFFAAAVWSYRVRAAEEAAEYLPAPVTPVFLPEGTKIEAVSRTKMPSTIAVGDKVTFFVSTPVTVNGKVEIPAGARLRGTVQSLAVTGKKAQVDMKFTELELLSRGQSIAIEAHGRAEDAPVGNDLDSIKAGLRTLAGVALGATIGAGSGDPKLVRRGVIEGASNAMTIDTMIPVTVTLDEALKISPVIR
jgi:hypothetical protein